MKIMIKWLISALAVLITAYIVPGVLVFNFWSALWVALLLGIVNAVIKPVLILLTLPINILSLGLFTFVINALMILLTSSIIKGFEVDGFLVALVFSLVLSFVSYFLNSLKSEKR